MVRYIVQRGDTLWSIAEKFDTSVEEIARVNGIRNPHMIHKGVVLRIPSPHFHNHHHGSHTHQQTPPSHHRNQPNDYPPQPDYPWYVNDTE
nr:LysM domain-containing protein [Alicyclobacillus suci]